MFDRRYAALREAQPPRDDEGSAFDDHVLACIAAAALEDYARERRPLNLGLGLTGPEARAFFAYAFPLGAAPFCLQCPQTLELFDEEEMVRALLSAHLAPDDEAGRWLTPLIARRAMGDDHLWQDLGLMNRGELNRLLARHFPVLHAGNVDNMRWKKYFYRQICEQEGFSLCAVPRCADCVDFSACFGEEDGMSRLAAIARGQVAA